MNFLFTLTGILNQVSPHSVGISDQVTPLNKDKRTYHRLHSVGYAHNPNRVELEIFQNLEVKNIYVGSGQRENYKICEESIVKFLQKKQEFEG